MAKFHVMAPKPGEYEKFVADRQYQMEEEFHSEMNVPNEMVAQANLRRGILNGDYPKGSSVVEVS